ncbi:MULTISPECIES: F0F1 ATP synthase subunit B [Pseudoalteromonas]|uniref:ATP synthase subunit b n=3 Tax=Pseudoalteromonas luteoviolacea TaxID=43657 RepID=A0A167J801_9GAMM|nr:MULTISPECIES: F0F1 ATP synthase subunit B [Pseudoalteromonas]AOT10091.1 F0F1 ATP synthase subunit B [Pseudoalteromonas luteoviolacea]AOT15002.1 F0F1 ATP synthase subunit B [Pseudoalteromonas luteoviolacea]AOT19918.1 F0F1 ATP synthase subunit B [Pseudoalteromonas luteoviolacea]KKE82360.1 F0F1 ATP synthase subunit B [Pseudoalteromonas luteoviolacea S4054]KZN54867.1 F0F1 ATP synthase subunit B [Pseudoalteromonas luteoviolacea H33]
MNLNATLIGELIAFTVFVLFCMKYVWPPLNGAIEARQKKIEDGLAASDKAEKDLEQAREQAAEQLKEAKTQAAEIIEQAKKRAALIVDEETTRGQQEREKIIAQGHSDIETERNRVKEELRTQVATLAVVGAEKILEREINQDAHSDIVDKLVAEL